MQAVIDFLVNNYLWFLIISLILVFALIGYLVDTTTKPNTSKTNLSKTDSTMGLEQDNINLK